MKNSVNQFDVAIVGASVAGCTTAMLYAQKGLRVALIERQSDINAYKKACTHFLQPFVAPVLKRLGLIADLEAAGAVRNRSRTWTRFGWVGDDSGKYYGYNVRRETLDPLLRRKAASMPNVTLLLGTAVRNLIIEGKRVVGVEVSSADREKYQIAAKLVVGADGRYSPVARLAGLKEESRPNNRFLYFGYYRNVNFPTPNESLIWLNNGGAYYMMPNDDGQTVVACAQPKHTLLDFKQDLTASVENAFANLPDAPSLKTAEQVGKFRGMLDMPNISRVPTGKGVALVGDAAMAIDPLWGTGCARAMQAASWLVDATSKALVTGEPHKVDQTLQQYAQKVIKRLSNNFERMSDFSARDSFNLWEQMMFAAAAKEPQLARYAGPYSSQWAQVTQQLPLKKLGEAVQVVLNNQLGVPLPKTLEQAFQPV